MKKYSKLIIAIIIGLIFIGTFVFLYQKSQPKPVTYKEFQPKKGDIARTTIITGKIEPGCCLALFMRCWVFFSCCMAALSSCSAFSLLILSFFSSC